MGKEEFNRYLVEHEILFSKLSTMAHDVMEAAGLIIDSLKRGNKILVCGNGGSAADSQHLAAELVGRFEKERRALPSIALTTDTSILTALGNDYGYEYIFARQIEALGVSNDTLIGISTSGNSKNVILAVEAAEAMGIKTIGLLGRDGGELGSMVDNPVIISHSNTARIQEAHIFIIHFWAAHVENSLFENNAV